MIIALTFVVTIKFSYKNILRVKLTGFVHVLGKHMKDIVLLCTVQRILC